MACPHIVISDTIEVVLLHIVQLIYTLATHLPPTCIARCFTKALKYSHLMPRMRVNYLETTSPTLSYFAIRFNLKYIVAKDDPVIELPKAETQNGKGRMNALTDEGLNEQYEQQLMIMRQRVSYLDKMASPLEQAQRLRTLVKCLRPCL